MRDEVNKLYENRSAAIDITRIVACMMVLMVHIGQFCGLGEIVGWGQNGVKLFFVLSGFLAMKTMEGMEEHRSENEKAFDIAIKYYKSRIRRIVPLYYWCLTIGWFYLVLSLRIKANMSFSEILLSGNTPCGIEYLRYYFFLNFFIPSYNYEYFNNIFGYWTMSCFALFYLFVPLIFYILKNVRVLLATEIILIALYSPVCLKLIDLWSVDRMYDGIGGLAFGYPPCTIWIFMLGVVAYKLKTNNQKYAATFLTFIVCFATNFEFHPYDFSAFVILIVAGSCENLLHIKQADKIAKVLAYMGKLSFPVYLSHIVILNMVLGTGLIPANVKTGPLLLVIVLIGSWFNYSLFEIVQKKVRKIAV